MKVLCLTPIIALALTGCITAAKTAVDLVTLPVKVVSKGVDLATTSQSEADEKRGRDLRKAEEDFGKRSRAWEKQCKPLEARGQACPPAPAFVSPNARR